MSDPVVRVEQLCGITFCEYRAVIRIDGDYPMAGEWVDSEGAATAMAKAWATAFGFEFVPREDDE